MRGIVLPPVTAADVIPVTALNIIDPVPTADVRVAIEAVIPVDIDVVASPTTAPTPTATTPGGADCHADAE